MSSTHVLSYVTSHVCHAPSARDTPARKLSLPADHSGSKLKLDEWRKGRDKCEIAQDSLTAVHRFVAYNAGWLQQALGE